MTIIVSYSEIAKWQVCQRQYYYRHILNRVPIEISDAIDTGNKGHKFLQDFHELLRSGKTKEEAREVIRKKANDIVHSAKFPDFNLLKAWTLVDNYIRDTDFTSEAILIENRFLIPVDMFWDDPNLSDVQIGFTPDVVFQRKGGWNDVEDYKFIQRKWTSKKVDRYQQLNLYKIFLELMGYNISRCTLRFFNVQTAVISDKNYVPTAKEEEILIRDFMAGVKAVVEYKRQPIETYEETPRTMNYNSCQYCEYDHPCGLDASGKDSTNTLQNMYTVGKYDYTK